MNEQHLMGLSSPAWRQILERDMLPWVETVADLGDDLLEVGPGPGMSTDLLRERVARLTAVEVDPELAAKLRERLAGTNVEVLDGSGTRLPFPDARFSAVACFAVLHHVPTRAEQDEVLAEIFRVLRPGASLVASDAYDDERTRSGHVDDTFVPMDPETLADRLGAFGFTDVGVHHGEFDYRFCARKPG